MKKVVVILGALFCFGTIRAQYNYCNFNPTFVQGVEASVHHNIDMNHCNYVDSFKINWGDGTIYSSNGCMFSTQLHNYCQNGTYNITINMYMDPIYAIPNCVYNTTATISIYQTSSDLSHTQNNNVVDFTANTQANIYYPANNYWNFGDGNTASSIEDTILHSYATTGTYYPSVTTSLYYQPNNCSSSIIAFDTVVITSTYPPCLITPEFTTIKNGLTVDFINLTTCFNCQNQTYKWDFGDGSPFSYLPNPSHTFPYPYNFNVCLWGTSEDSVQIPCASYKCHYFDVSWPNHVTNLMPINIAIFPNPAHKLIGIRSDKNIRSLEFFDITGNQIQNFDLKLNISKEFDYDISSFNNGIYFLKIIGEDNKAYFHKIIKQ